MRKIIVQEFITLNGIMQAPGGPEEDTSSGFRPNSNEHLNKIFTLVL